ncbi:MAG: glutamate racemase [Candidatus Hatepunaea meridiana]|nr:glutamate racemase [Candidatus Hatepunaea meridiana]
MSHTSDHPIGVFDSGIGGLTVAAALRDRLPAEDIIYLGDTARVPYGTKSVETVNRYALESTLFLLNLGVKLIVVACNTASAVALPRLQEVLRAPIIGVVEPGVNAALRATKTKQVGIIGTPSTINSGAYQNRLKKLAPNIEVYGKPCPLLVPLCEEGRLDGQIVKLVLEDYLKQIKRKGVDTLILGCTHYPLLKPAIADVMGADTLLVDSAQTTAEVVEESLLREGLLRTHGPGTIKCYITDKSKQFNKLGKRFFGQSLGQVVKAQLNESS